MWLRWSCVLQLAGIATQNRAGAAHEVCRQCEWAQMLRGLEALQQVEANIARVALIRQSGENVVPKRFRAFISIHSVAMCRLGLGLVKPVMKAIFIARKNPLASGSLQQQTERSDQ